MVPQLISIAAATLVSEDLTCIGAGILVAQGEIATIPAIVACTGGILAGDLLLFLAGRVAGRRLLRHRWVSRWIKPERVKFASAWIERQGLHVVFLSRFTPGLRLPTYVAAGMLSVRPWTFVLYFILAAAVWTPLLMLSAVKLGDAVAAGSPLGSSPRLALLAATVGASFLLVRRIVERLLPQLWNRAVQYRKYLHWEFWPTWAAYLPLVPWWILLALRYRSALLFTLSNPGMPAGGLCGESKSEILSHLENVPGAVAPFGFIPAHVPHATKLAIAHRFLAGKCSHYPVVLKPDVGERGSGVAIVRSDDELETHLRNSMGDLIIQEYIEGVEFGVFYVRHPEELRGRIVSITEKRFPTLLGDGVHSIRELIARDPRASLIVSTYERNTRHDLGAVPAEGEKISLVEIGSHCRGAIFLNATAHVTPLMEESFHRISMAHPGFFFGRYDVRASSLEALQAGRDFRVLELNGVSGEPTHVYDPSVNFISAYSALFGHWNTAWEIGAWHRTHGLRPATLREVLDLLLKWKVGKAGVSGKASPKKLADAA